MVTAVFQLVAFQKLFKTLPSVTTQRISPSGGHFFHGLCGLSVWDREDCRVLAHHVANGERLPEPGEEATIGLLDVATSDFQPLGSTTAWNFITGSMLQFIGDGDRIWYNQHNTDGTLGSCVQDLQTDDILAIQSPIYWVNEDGEWGVGYDMERAFWCMPGYSYINPVPVDQRPEELSENEDGLRKVYADGRPWELLVSYTQIAETIRPWGYEDEFLFLRRIYGFSAGSHLVFSASHIGRAGKLSNWLFLLNIESKRLEVLIPPDQGIKQFLLQSDQSLMLCLRKPPMESWKEGLFFYNFAERSLKPFERAFFMCEGHYLFAEKGNHLICGAFPDKEDGIQRLYSMRLNESNFRSLAQFATRKLPLEVRSNLSPNVSRNEKSLVVNSFHEDFRGIYLVNL